MAQDEEDKKQQQPSALYEASAQGNGSLRNPDTESVSRSAQYHVGTQHTDSTTTHRTGGLPAELQAQRDRELAQTYAAHDVEVDPATGQLRPNAGSSTIGDLLGMRESAEEAERKARLKKTASGIYQSLATLSDIISGAAGGNVYKREKDNVISDADKEADAKKQALIAAEAAAKEKDRQRMEKAAQQAAAINARYDALRDKVSTNSSASESESAGVSNGGQKGKSKQPVTGTDTDSTGAGGSRSAKGNTMTFSVGIGGGDSTEYSGYINFTVDKARGRQYADKAIAEMYRLYKLDTTNARSKNIIKRNLSSIGIDIDGTASTPPALNDAQVQALMNLGLAFGTNGLDRELQTLYRSSPEYAQAYTRLVSSERYKRAGEAEQQRMVQSLDIQTVPFNNMGEDKAFHLSPAGTEGKRRQQQPRGGL